MKSSTKQIIWLIVSLGLLSFPVVMGIIAINLSKKEPSDYVESCKEVRLKGDTYTVCHKVRKEIKHEG